MRMPTASSIVDILPAMDAEFVDDGYIRVYQDIRGLHNSEGEFVMNRPIVGPLNNTGIDEVTDAYDTIDWLVKNVPEINGKVGDHRLVLSRLHGAGDARSIPHPALKAAVPQSPMVDGWMGDDWFHNGAFRQPNFDYVAKHGKVDAGDNGACAARRGRRLHALPEARVGRRLCAQVWASTNYPFVAEADAEPGLYRLLVAAGGRQMDGRAAAHRADHAGRRPVGPGRQLRRAGRLSGAEGQGRRHSDMLHLVIGPWRHSGANHYGYELGALTFTGDTARELRAKYMKPFLDHYLKGAPDPHTPPVLTYATGINKWEASPTLADGHADAALSAGERQRSASTSPRRRRPRRLCLRPGQAGAVLPRPVTCATATRGAPGWSSDQRFVDGRPDVLSYETAPLDKRRPHHGRAAGRPVRRHQRHRQRLGGEADRRLSDERRRAPTSREHGRLRAADRHRDLPRPLCRQLRQARAR